MTSSRVMVKRIKNPDSANRVVEVLKVFDVPADVLPEEVFEKFLRPHLPLDSLEV
ncbi:MAG: hypothetical protein Kow00107_06320 [Planctomycetota bacterium]